MLNLTQHMATPDQIEDGVFEPSPEMKKKICDLLTFDDIPSEGDICERASQLAQLVSETGQAKVMIGGAPYLMGALERSLVLKGIIPFYSFSVRKSEETTMPNGDVKKTNVFKHVGFIKAIEYI